MQNLQMNHAAGMILSASSKAGAGLVILKIIC